MKIKEFFFKNAGIRQTVIKNTFWLMFAEIIARLTSLVLVIYTARILGANEYGKFTFALSFATIMLIVSDFGITDISTREFARNNENEKRFNAIFFLEIALCVFALCVSIIGSFFVTQDVTIRYMVFVLTLFVLMNSLFGIIFSFFRSRHKMEYEAIIKIVQSALGALCILPIIFYFPSAKNVSYGYLAANFLVLCITLLFFHIYFQRLRLRWDISAFHILKSSWPLSFGFMAGWVYIYINAILLGYFNLITENGWYGAASRIAIASIIPANLIVKSFYPLMSNFFINSKEKLQKAWNYLLEGMIFLAFPIVIGGWMLGNKIIFYFYGASFMPAVFSFQILTLVVAINFINYPYAIMLVISDNQKKNFSIMVGGAILNIILDFFLIPTYHLGGAVIATCIASLAVLVTTMTIAQRFSPIILFNKTIIKGILISGCAGVIMYGVLQFLLRYNFNIFLDCLIGALVYFIVFYFSYRVVFGQSILRVKDFYT